MQEVARSDAMMCAGDVYCGIQKSRLTVWRTQLIGPTFSQWSCAIFFIYDAHGDDNSRNATVCNQTGSFSSNYGFEDY